MQRTLRRDVPAQPGGSAERLIWRGSSASGPCATSPLVMGALYPLSYGRASAVAAWGESMEGSAR